LQRFVFESSRIRLCLIKREEGTTEGSLRKWMLKFSKGALEMQLGCCEQILAFGCEICGDHKIGD
jgi:hypothetical protein